LDVLLKSYGLGSTNFKCCRVFCLPGNDVLRATVEAAADDIRVRRAETQAPVQWRYSEARFRAKS
jgi:hypothetical protein